MKSPLTVDGDYTGIFHGCLFVNKRRAEHRPYIVFSVIFQADHLYTAETSIYYNNAIRKAEMSLSRLS